MAALRAAADAGYHNAARIQSVPDLYALRGDPEFQLFIQDQLFPTDPIAR
jgi:hypothetical protein